MVDVAKITCQLATGDGLLGRPEKLVGRLAIHEAMAEVVSCFCCCYTPSARRDMAAVGVASVGIEYCTILVQCTQQMQKNINE